MNKLLLKGHIGQDATVHQISENRFAISFTLAVDESYKDANGNKVPRTKWFKCVRFSQTQKLAAFLTKGLEIIVIGSAGADAYLKDGNAIATPTITITEFEWINTKKTDFVPQHVANSSANIPENNFVNEENDLPF